MRLLLLALAAVAVDGARVLLVNGTVEGEELLSVGLGCAAFRGLPFAAAPTGQRRWRKPSPHAGWEGVLLAKRGGPACAQHTGKGQRLPESTPVDEDCLNLNAADDYPVVVWVHGGGFGQGAAGTIEDEELCTGLVARGVVFVALNYRLGPFGFLDADGARNLAVWDILKGVEWVRENIASFGGDADRLTLGGDASGAALVSLISLSPKCPPLHGLLLMSGSCLAPWAVGSPSGMATQLLSRHSDCGGDGRALPHCLANASTEEILRLVPSGPGWAPIPDAELLDAAPRTLLETGRFASVPTIIGLNHDDAADIVLEQLVASGKRLDKSVFLSDVVPPFAAGLLNTTEAPVLDALRFQYFSHPTDNLFDHLHNAAKMYTDFLYRSPVLLEAFLRSKRRRSQVFVYSFEEPSYLEMGTNQRWKVTPSESALAHLFGLASTRNGARLSFTPTLSQVISRLFAAFVRNETSAQAFAGWAPFTPKAPVYLRLQSRLELRTGNLERQMRFWSNFVPSLIRSLRPPPPMPPPPPRTRLIEKIVYRTEATTPPSPESRKTVVHAGFVPETRTVLWVMVGLATLFALLFLSTAAGCSLYHKGVPRYRRPSDGPNTRSRHQAARIRPAPRIPQRPPPQIPVFTTGVSHC